MSNFTLGLGLFMLLAFAIVALFWPVIVVAVVLIAKRNKKKKKQAAIEAETVSRDQEMATTPASPPATSKPKDNTGGINVMLIVGCLLLVFGIIKFFNDTNDSLVAPVAIVLTLVFYTLGLAIYNKISYLKIVGAAFTYISLMIFPFWVISFNTFGISWHGSWILASIITFCALLLTTILHESKPLSYFAYLWLFVVAWALTPDHHSYGYSLDIQAYWVYVSSAIVALIPAVLWKLKPNWLPVYFRKATQVFAKWFMPIVGICSLLLLLFTDPMIRYPFLRTVMATLMLGWAYLYWSINKAYSWSVALRFFLQALLLTLTMDLLNYSIADMRLFGSKIDDSTRLVVTAVWLASSLAQTIISLFIPKTDEKVRKCEHVAEIVSLVGIFATPIFTLGLNDPANVIVNLIVCGVCAILGIAYTIAHNNPRWSAATILALFMARLVIAGSSLFIGWSAWLDVIYFTIVSGLIIAIYQFFRKYHENDSLILTITGLMISLLEVVASAAAAEYTEIGWLIAALYFALLGFLSKQTVLYEMSIYSGTFCLYSLTGTIGEFMLPDSAAKCVTGPFSMVKPCSGLQAASYVGWIATINTIRCFLIGISLSAVSALKESHKPVNARIRFFLGYVLMSIGLFAVGVTAGEYWMLFCLAVQVGYLIFAAIHDIEWLVWTTIIAMPACAFGMTGGFTYIWYAVLGLTLIGAVIWRLTKMNHAKLAEGSKENNSTPRV